jgi:hypothetical protein
VDQGRKNGKWGKGRETEGKGKDTIVSLVPNEVKRSLDVMFE